MYQCQKLLVYLLCLVVHVVLFGHILPATKHRLIRGQGNLQVHSNYHQHPDGPQLTSMAAADD